MKSIVIYSLLFGAATAAESEPKTPKVSNAIRADIKLMWETVPMRNEHNKKASRVRATEAAHRVFTAVPFDGMTRQEVIQLIGDPAKSSDSIYNLPFNPTAKGNLVYRFDTGYGGWQFDFSFDKGNRVIKVATRDIE